MASGGTAATTLVEAARELRPRILGQREQIEAGRRLPEELGRELARAGFFRASLPAAYGGLQRCAVPPMKGKRVELLDRCLAEVIGNRAPSWRWWGYPEGG